MAVLKVFIACSRASAPLLSPIVDDLEGIGCAVLLDRSLPGGDEWWQGAMDLLEGADVFVYALTTTSLDSDQCRLELEYAETLQIPVLPVLLDEGLSDLELPAALGRIQRIDYRGADRSGLAAMVRALRGLPRNRGPLGSGDRPSVPRAYRLDIANVLSGEDHIGPGLQHDICAQLWRCAEDGFSADELHSVMESLRTRADLTNASHHELIELDDVLRTTRADGTSWPDLHPDRAATSADDAVQSVFVSYSRSERGAVTAVVDDLRQLGFVVWIDQNLPGGQQWWDQVLFNIRESDALMLAAGPASVYSRACLAEVAYATGLGKPILRVDVDADVTLPPDLAIVAQAPSMRYDATSRTSVRELAVAMSRLSRQPLADPLPDPPDIPATYIFDVGAQVRHRGDLNPAQQQAIVDQLQRHADEGVPRTDIARLLIEFSHRDDITVSVAESIRALTRSLDVDAGKLGLDVKPDARRYDRRFSSADAETSVAAHEADEPVTRPAEEPPGPTVDIGPPDDPSAGAGADERGDTFSDGRAPTGPPGPVGGSSSPAAARSGPPVDESVVARGADPAIHLTPTVVDFGNVVYGQSPERLIRVAGDGGQPLAWTCSQRGGFFETTRLDDHSIRVRVRSSADLRNRGGPVRGWIRVTDGVSSADAEVRATFARAERRSTAVTVVGVAIALVVALVAVLIVLATQRGGDDDDDDVAGGSIAPRNPGPAVVVPRSTDAVATTEAGGVVTELPLITLATGAAATEAAVFTEAPVFTEPATTEAPVSTEAAATTQAPVTAPAVGPHVAFPMTPGPDWPDKLVFAVSNFEDDSPQPPADALSERLGIPVEPISGYGTELVAALQSGRAQLAGGLGSVDMVQAEDEAGADLILQSERDGSFEYVTQWFTNDPDTFCSDTPVADPETGLLSCNGVQDATSPSDGSIGEEHLADVAGNTVAFGWEGTVDDHLVPSLELLNAGVDPENGITPLFIHSDEDIVRAVYDGDAQVGVSHIDARTRLSAEHPDVGDKVVVFAWSSPIPNDGFAVAGDLPEDLKDGITAALLDITSTPEGILTLEPAMWDIDGLRPVNPADYDIIRELRTKLPDLLE